MPTAPVPYHVEKMLQEPLVKMLKANGLAPVMQKFQATKEEVFAELKLLRYKYDTELFAEERLWITNKLGQLVPLIYNKGQKRINEAIVKQKQANKAVRICLLKSRQFGGSTLFEAEIFKENLMRPHRSCMIVAHDLDSARHLRDMSQRYYDCYDVMKPRIKKESDKWWKFLHFDENDRRSYSHLRIDTAEELSTGISLTIHNLHLSEVQNWRDAQKLARGLLPTVPPHADTMIFMEGTGSGVGDYWYDFCQMSQGHEDWEFVFVAWYEIEDYTLKFQTEDERSNFEARLDGEERLLYKSHVALEQLNWRRHKIDTDYKGDVDGFRQQYPSNPDEAFLTSGRPVFSQLKVRENMLVAQEGKIGSLVWRNDGDKKKIIFVEEPKGLWELWEEPVKGSYLYCSGNDVAEGIAVQPELGNRGGDKCSSKVFRRDLRKFVAKLNAQIDPDLFSDELEKASLFWEGTSGQLPLLIENNPGGSGNVVIRDLKLISGVNILKTVTLDRVHDTRKEEYGWDTNKESKREMIDELVEAIRDSSFSDPDKESWYQASTYVRDEKGRTNAQSRKFDDEVVATALTLQADKMLPRWSLPKTESEVKITVDMDVPENWKKGRGGTTQDKVMEKTYADF